MNMKRMIAIFAAVMMLVCLFSACSNQPAATTDNSSSSSSTTTDNKTDTATTDNKTDDKKDETTTTTDTPAENDELVTISWMGRGNQDNLNAAREANYANLAKYDEIMAQYGFVIESSQMDTSVYASTIHSLRAAGQLPDSFISYGMIDNDTIVSWIEAGIFVSCTDMMAESTGNMAKFFADDGALKFAKAAATYTDGDWYYVFMTNDTARSIQLTESDGPLRAVIQVHGAYDVMIRQDWLDKLDIALPTTADEYFEACLAMNENDVNGNGQKDERIIMTS
jgi:ABC-type glycerol-3-phosphate transport system substrate-binding protein